jgi:hypothetical protein
MNPTNSFLNQTVALLTEESFIADLKTFFSSGWHIVQVLSSVIYLLVGQVYVWGQSANSWLSTKVSPLKIKLYNSVASIDHPLAQFITSWLHQDIKSPELPTTPLLDNNGNHLTIRLQTESVSSNQTPHSMDSQEQLLSHTNN